MITRHKKNRGCLQKVMNNDYSVEARASKQHSHRKLTKKELIQNYKDIKKKIGHVPTTTEMDRYGKNVPDLYRRRWGSWSSFLKELGETPSKRVYKRIVILKEDLIEAYLKYKKLYDKAPTLSELHPRGKSTYEKTYKKYFRGYKQFLYQVEDMETKKKNYLKDYIELTKTLDRFPLPSEVNTTCKITHPRYLSLFGGTKKLKLLAMSSNALSMKLKQSLATQIRKVISITKGALITSYKEYKAQHNKVPTFEELYAFNRHASRYYKKYFKGYKEFIAKMGDKIDAVKKKELRKEQYFKDYIELIKKFGCFPTRIEVDTLGKIGHAYICILFGGRKNLQKLAAHSTLLPSNLKKVLIEEINRSRKNI